MVDRSGLRAGADAVRSVASRRLAVRLTLLLVLGTLVAVLLQGVLSSRLARRSVEAGIDANLSALAAHLAELLDRNMFERSREVQILASLPQVRDRSATRGEVRELLETVQRTYPAYAWIGLTDATGTVVASTGGLLEGADVAGRPWFQAGVRGGFVGDVHEAKLLAELLPQPDGEPLRFVDVATAVYDETGQLRGVLGAHLSWAWATDAQAAVLDSVEPARQIEVIVARGDGQVILGPPSLRDQPLPEAALQLASDSGGARLLRWPDGRLFLTTAERSVGHASYPGLGWVVLVRQPAEVALAPADALAWQLALSTLGVAGLLIVLTSVTVGRATAPLRRIAAAAKELQVGEPDAALPLLAGQDEVASLSQALHRLVASLLRQEAQLAAANARLMAELGARTAAEATARTQAAHATALAQVAARLNAQLDLPTIVQTVCAATSQALGMQAASLRFYNPATGQLELVGSVGMPAGYKKQLAELPPDLWGDLLTTPVLSIPAPQEPPERWYTTLARSWDVQAALSAPLVRNGELLGTLSAFAIGVPHAIDAATEALLRGIADQASQAIVNARTYSQAAQRLEQLQALRAIDHAITGGHDLAHVLATGVEQVARLLGVDAVAVRRYEPAKRWLRWSAGVGFGEPPGPDPVELAASPAGEAITERRRVSRRNLAEVAPERGAGAYGAGFVAYYGAPLIADGEVLGVLELFHRSPLSPDAEWLELLDTLAGQIAIAVAHATLFTSLQEAHAALVRAYDTTIDGWSRALDLRDKETEGHSRRVTTLTLQIARVMGVPEDELTQMRRGALLHDIGKMGIPDRILLKPGPLDAEEWQLMKQHPVLAFELLAPIGYLRPALDIPYAHHERWDGSGYPRGLSGTAIPLAARIFAVADVWDALTHDRPYHAARSPVEARAMIVAQAGCHFDPEVVAAFLRVLDA